MWRILEHGPPACGRIMLAWTERELQRAKPLRLREPFVARRRGIHCEVASIAV